MAELLLRDMDQGVMAGLEARAVRRGVSPEEAAKEILKASVAPPPLTREEILAQMAACRSRTVLENPTTTLDVIREMRAEE